MVTVCCKFAERAHSCTYSGTHVEMNYIYIQITELYIFMSLNLVKFTQANSEHFTYSTVFVETGHLALVSSSVGLFCSAPVFFHEFTSVFFYCFIS